MNCLRRLTLIGAIYEPLGSSATSGKVTAKLTDFIYAEVRLIGRRMHGSKVLDDHATADNESTYDDESAKCIQSDEPNLSTRPNRRNSNTFLRSPFDMNRRLETVDKKYLQHYPDHPVSILPLVEKELLQSLFDLNRSCGVISTEDVYDCMKRVIINYSSACFTEQRLADIMATFVSLYDSDWIREMVIPHFPNASKRLNLLSPHIMAMCIAAFWKQESLSSYADKFVSATFQDLQKCDSFNRLIPQLKIDVLSTVIKSTSWKDAYISIKSTNDGLSTLLAKCLKKAASCKEYKDVFEILKMGKCPSIPTQRLLFDWCIEQVIENLPESSYTEFLYSVSTTSQELSTQSANHLLKKWKVFLSKQGLDAENAKITKINKSGVCTSCGNKLDHDKITPDEVNHLKDLFYQMTIKGQGLWHLADPRQIEKFVKYVSEHAPFDIVIDGLNYFHKDYISSTIEVAENLCKGKNNILIVTRRHGVKQIPTHIAEKSAVFFVSDDAIDDVFVMYAALASGTDCYILSSDGFTHHSKYLRHNMESFELLTRWQRLRQIPKPADLVDIGFLKRSKFNLGFPLEVQLSTQLNRGFWHVPIYNKFMPRSFARYPLHQSWLCLPALKTK